MHNWVAIISLILSFWVGFIDIVFTIFESPNKLSSFNLILYPFIATAIICFAVHILLWFLTISFLKRFLTVKPVIIAISIAVFLLTAFTLARINNFTQYSVSITNMIKLSLQFLISLSISMGAYFTTKAAGNSKYRNTITLFILTTPFILMETLGFLYIHKFIIDDLFSMQSYLLIIGYIIITFFIVILFFRIGQINIQVRSVFVFMFVIILSPAISIIVSQCCNKTFDEVKIKDHYIKNVLLITVDTLRADVLSCYRKNLKLTPHIDKLAADGIIFENAISSSSWTLPSLASIITGLPPTVHMALERGSKLSDNLPTLAEYMRDEGYYTAAVGYNPWLTPVFNLSQGFIEYDIYPKSIGNSFGEMVLGRIFPRTFSVTISTSVLTQIGINWLYSNSERDFFFWIHFFDPHIPYTPPPYYIPNKPHTTRIGTSLSLDETAKIKRGSFVPTTFEREWIKDLYKGEVRYIDENIGKLIDTLKHLNLYNESLIILTSDHGEEFWEHDGFEHGHTLYNEILHVPLIIKPPMSSSEQIVPNIVATQSLTPTILDLCRIDYNRENYFAPSLSPLWGPDHSLFEYPPIVSEGIYYSGDRQSVVFDRKKYIRFILSNREELYDLAKDPNELMSIIPLSNESLKRSRTILQEYEEKAKNLRNQYHIVSGNIISIDNKTKQNLRSLGYIQ